MFMAHWRHRIGRWAALLAAMLALAVLVVLVAGSAQALAAQAPGEVESLQPPDPYLILDVNYGHDWVEGTYEAGHTLWLTVTDEAGAVKATAELQTGQLPWGPPENIGFSTNVGDPWKPLRPDIAAGDWVYGRVDNGRTAEVQLGEITGTPNVGNDTIAGNVYANWLPEPIGLSCSVWEQDGPGLDLWIDPDGGDYFCDFGALGWNLLPGHDVSVQYQEPGGHRVMNVFQEPAPNLRLEKWPEGSGQAFPGGAAVFHLRVQNDGDAAASQVIVTDTLPANASYASDSSGVTPTFAGSEVIWDLGPLASQQQIDFYLYLDHTAGDGDTIHNVADAWALYDNQVDDNHAEADVQVVAEFPDLWINKHPETANPMAGETMLWRLDYGNQGPVASGPVELTDTLPAGTTVVEWWSANGYGWEEVSSNGQLVLRTPSVPGHWGDQIYLRLAVNSGLAVETQLANTAEVVTSADTDPDNNRTERDDVWVSEEWRNASVDKSLSWATLVPGGSIEYSVGVRNNGNAAATFVLTDVLPAGTSFDAAWLNQGSTNVPFPPDHEDNTMAVWELGVLEPGAWRNLQVRLAIAPATAAGAVLENCAYVDMGHVDHMPYDNEACHTSQVNPPGPNLAVDKTHRWNGHGQLEYNIQVHNLGITLLEDVVLTDVLPAGTAFNGNWSNWFQQPVMLTDQSATELVWTIQRMEPGWSAGLAFQVDLDGGLVGVPGLAFTNTVEAPVAGDVAPGDNEDTEVAYSGPDLYVKKELTGGQPVPGGIITFTVELGNANQGGPWGTAAGTHLTETLPAATTFVTATAPWDPSQPWVPESVEGNTVVWAWKDLTPGEVWFFDVVVEIDQDASNGDVLMNTVEIGSDDPEQDVEFDVSNNTAQAVVTVQGAHRIYLPLVLRNG